MHPDWDYWSYFFINHVQRELEIDSGTNARPMTLYVEDSNAIVLLFNSVAFSKGTLFSFDLWYQYVSVFYMQIVCFFCSWFSYSNVYARSW